MSTHSMYHISQMLFQCKLVLRPNVVVSVTSTKVCFILSYMIFLSLNLFTDFFVLTFEWQNVSHSIAIMMHSSASQMVPIPHYKLHASKALKYNTWINKKRLLSSPMFLRNIMSAQQVTYEKFPWLSELFFRLK